MFFKKLRNSVKPCFVPGSKVAKFSLRIQIPRNLCGSATLPTRVMELDTGISAYLSGQSFNYTANKHRNDLLGNTDKSDAIIRFCLNCKTTKPITQINAPHLPLFLAAGLTAVAMVKH